MTPDPTPRIVPGPNWCPTCNASEQDECATTSGRDHPRRSTWAAAYRAGHEAAKAESEPLPS